MAGPNRFAKAAAKAEVAPKGKKDEALILTPPDDQIREAIDAYVAAKDKMKEAEGEKQVANDTCLPWIKGEWLKTYATNGRPPEKIKVKGMKETVNLITQDRGGRYNVSDEQLETLKTILGPEKAEGIISEFTEFSIDSDLLNRPGVADVLSGAIDKLVSTKVLTQEEADKLLVAKARRVIKSGTYDSMAALCNNNPDMMTLLTEALGSNVVVYIM